MVMTVRGPPPLERLAGKPCILQLLVAGGVAALLVLDGVIGSGVEDVATGIDDKAGDDDTESDTVHPRSDVWKIELYETGPSLASGRSYRSHQR
jgi:hypothetical protein